MRILVGRIGTLALTIALVGGCSTLSGMFKKDPATGGGGGARARLRAGGDPAEVRARVEAFEKIRPDADELSRGGNDAYDAMIAEHRATSQQVQLTFEEAESRVLVDRLWEAKRRYMLDAARIAMSAQNPNLAFWVLRPFIDDTYKYKDMEEEELQAVRDTAKARATQKREEVAQRRTYAADGIGGNCVFSTQEFGEDGAENAGLGYYFAGPRLRVHVRCITEDDLTSFSGPQGKFYVKIAINGHVWWGKPAGTPADYRKGDRALEASFTIPKGDIAKDDFAMFDASAGFEWQKGWTWDTSGAQPQEVPTWDSRQLAGSTFFWERTGR